MNIIKNLFTCITLLFFITTVVHANDSDKKIYHEKMWGGNGKSKQCPMKNMFGQCPIMGMKPPPMMGMGGSFTMIEAQGSLFLYNKKTGDIWVCNAFKKICEQILVENKGKD